LLYFHLLPMLFWYFVLVALLVLPPCDGNEALLYCLLG
jgi:hypothetical protein